MGPCVLATLIGMLTTVSVTSDATVARAFAFLCNTCVMVVRRAWSSLRRRKIEHSGRAFDYLCRSEGVHANTVSPALPLRDWLAPIVRLGVRFPRADWNGKQPGWQSATNFTNAVDGTASNNPIPPHSQLLMSCTANRKCALCERA
jgi:hypothetical protein